MKRLSVLVATTAERLHRLSDLLQPEAETVDYVVSCQYDRDGQPPTVPDFLSRRRDVSVCFLEGRGLSRNRNNALDHWTTELAVIADDDVIYAPGVFERLIRLYDTRKDLDIICCCATDLGGNPIKPYAPAPFRYEHRPKGAYFSSIELTMRRHPALPRFDLRFGLGASCLNSGEEEVFLHEAQRNGLHIGFEPFVLCATSDTNTTGRRFDSEVKVRRSKGAVLCRLHGFPMALLRIAKFALCHCHRHRIAAFRDMTAGAWYVLKTSGRVAPKTSPSC